MRENCPNYLAPLNNAPSESAGDRKFGKDQYHAAEFYIYYNDYNNRNEYLILTQMHFYFENSVYVADVKKHLTLYHVYGPVEKLPAYNGTNLGILEEKYISERYTIYSQDFKKLVDLFVNNLSKDKDLSPNALAPPVEILYKMGNERISLKFQISDLNKPGLEKYSFIIDLLDRNIPNRNIDPRNALYNWDEK